MKNGVQKFALLCALSMGCQEEEVQSGFTTPTATGSEADGKQSITIDLGETTTSSTTITFRVGGDAALDGDYKLNAITEFAADSPLSIVVPEGQHTATISFELIDDAQIEPGSEVIYFEITDISDLSIANNMKRTQFAYEITDNDSSPASGIQVDLSWNLGDGVRINAANFDLYLASGLSLKSNGEVDTFEKVAQYQSTNTTGFESFVIPENVDDKEYYVMINYVSGNVDARVNLQMSQGASSGSATGRIGTAYVGKYAYYGPITKNGAVFAFK